MRTFGLFGSKPTTLSSEEHRLVAFITSHCQIFLNDQNLCFFLIKKTSKVLEFIIAANNHNEENDIMETSGRKIQLDLTLIKIMSVLPVILVLLS